MKKIIITATSDNGEKALQQHIKEFKKMGVKQRLLFKTAGYKHNVLGMEPCQVELVINSARFEMPPLFDMIQIEIINALKTNGAELTIDYRIEIKNDHDSIN